MNLYQIRDRLKTQTIYDLPLRVTFYARVSTDSDEQINSLGNQEQPVQGRHVPAVLYRVEIVSVSREQHIAAQAAVSFRGGLEQAGRVPELNHVRGSGKRRQQRQRCQQGQNPPDHTAPPGISFFAAADSFSGKSYKVTIENLIDSNKYPATVEYTINFFDYNGEFIIDGVNYLMNEYGELTERYKNEIPLLGLQSLMLRNQLISDNSLSPGIKNRDNSLYSANEERY